MRWGFSLVIESSSRSTKDHSYPASIGMPCGPKRCLCDPSLLTSGVLLSAFPRFNHNRTYREGPQYALSEICVGLSDQRGGCCRQLQELLLPSRAICRARLEFSTATTSWPPPDVLLSEPFRCELSPERKRQSHRVMFLESILSTRVAALSAYARPVTILALTGYISWRLWKWWVRRQEERLFAFQNGCQRLKPWKARWPLGLDMLLQALKSSGQDRILQFFVRVADQSGTTFEQNLLGGRGVNTIDPQNIEAILSTNFNGMIRFPAGRFCANSHPCACQITGLAYEHQHSTPCWEAAYSPRTAQLGNTPAPYSGLSSL
jgi:hypothetical protein